MGGKIEAKNMIVYFVGILIETAKGVNLVVAAVRHRRVHQTGRPLT